MRTRKLSLILVALALVAVSCDSVLESRVSELERRVAKLENGGAVATTTLNPSTTATTVASTEPEVKPEGPLPEFNFDSETFDFGAIPEGEVVEHTFTFTNTGEAPLIIQSASASCGCTVPSYSKEPVPVGSTGEIAVRFNSKGKKGNQAPTVTVTANTYPKIRKLRLKGSVDAG
ncbi:MAG: hypothetical protein DHS20C17_18350 [Cyclobacteriaceae bacterium]|nr:MAG: hypothetical protein DHS20C17_18350 [Cyclobacteriaceae bacterium]